MLSHLLPDTPSPIIFWEHLLRKIYYLGQGSPHLKFPKVRAIIYLYTNLLILSSLSSLPIYLRSQEYSNCKEVKMIKERDCTRKTI